MKNLNQAILEEKQYLLDRKHNINTSLLTRLEKYGYNNLTEYFSDKREFLFNQWIPEIIYIPIERLTIDLEKAIQEKKYGIYLSVAEGLYAFHGNDEIDYDLCEVLNISVAELYYQGGTIIGSPADLGIEIIAPSYLDLDGNYFLNKLYSIIGQYIENVSIEGNDILIDGYKIAGTMRRNVGDVFVWAAQISFGDYTDIISQVCNKHSDKKPGYIDHNKLTKDQLQKEFLEWLQKK